MKTAIVVVFASLAAASMAQFVVVPNAYATTSASTSGLNTFIRDSPNPRTGQLLINASQLASVAPGSQLTAMSFRLFSGATTTFPATTATWANFTVNIGAGVDPSTSTTTFATNFVGTPTTVRTGSLTMNPGSLNVGSPLPNPWGFTVAFTTPYTYTGGHLAVEVRHTGSNIVNNAANDFLEVALTTDPLYVAGAFRSFTATGETATTGAAANFTVTRFSVTPVPEPATMIALGAGALALMRRRRRS